MMLEIKGLTDIQLQFNLLSTRKPVPQNQLDKRVQSEGKCDQVGIVAFKPLHSFVGIWSCFLVMTLGVMKCVYITD